MTQSLSWIVEHLQRLFKISKNEECRVQWYKFCMGSEGIFIQLFMLRHGQW